MYVYCILALNISLILIQISSLTKLNIFVMLAILEGYRVNDRKFNFHTPKIRGKLKKKLYIFYNNHAGRHILINL